MSDKSIHKNLYEVLRAFSNVVADLFRKFPFFFFIIIGSIFLVIQIVLKSSFWVIAILCLLVTLLSLVIYSKNDNFGETSLTFILGLFTVFSIGWEPEKAYLFSFFFLGFITFVFLISSIKIAAKKESILTQAASYYNMNNFKHFYKELCKIADPSTQYGQLPIIKRAEVVRYFSFRKIPLNDIRALLEMTEQLSTISSIDYLKSAELLHTLYVTLNYSDQLWKYNILLFLNNLSSLPCSPSEFFRIFDLTKKHMILKKIQQDEYLELIIENTKLGLTPEDIEQIFNKKYS